MHRCWTLALLHLFLPAVCALAESQPAEKAASLAELLAPATPVAERTFANGLKVLVREDPGSSAVAIRAYVRAGSIYEGKYLGTGISHYFEHILAGGTTSTRSEAESRQIVRSIGGHSNAFTTYDYTCIYINTSAGHFVTAFELLADWLSNCLLRPQEFERERRVIMEEIALREEDPLSAAHWQLYETMFRVHPVRVPIIGYPSTFAKLTRHEVLEYYRRFYVPSNTLIVVVGNVPAEEVFMTAEKSLGRVPRGLPVTLESAREPRQVGPRYADKTMPVRAAYLMIGFHTIDLSHPDLYPLDVLAYILGRGRSARLPTRIRDEMGLAYEIDVWSQTPGFDAGVFGVYALCSSQNQERTREAILDEIRRAREEGVTEEEVQRAKTQVLNVYLDRQQTAEGQADLIGVDALTAGTPEFSRSYVLGVQKVTAEEVQAVAGRYLVPENMTVSVVQPGDEEQHASGPAEAVAPPPPKKLVLPSGLRILIGENPAPGLVSLQAHFLGGLRYETPATNGLFNLMARSLLRGTTTRSASQLAEEIESMGAAISATTGFSSFNISMTVLRPHLASGLELLADVVTAPAFDPQEVERERKIVLGLLSRRQDDWEQEALDLYRATLFRVHPYGMVPAGSEQGLAGLTLEQLKEAHRSFCAPGNMVLAIFGDIDPNEAETAAAAAFGSFRGPETYVPRIPSEPVLLQSMEVLRYTERQQASIVLGFPGVRIGDKDRYVLDVVDALISGINIPSGWLHDALRGERDLVYFVHAVNWMGLDPGSFYVMAQTSPNQVEEVVQLVRNQFGRLRQGRISKTELETAQNICTTAHDLDTQTSAAKAQEAALNELFGLGYEAGQAYGERIRRVTRQQVLEAARRYFEHPVLVVMKPKEK